MFSQDERSYIQEHFSALTPFWKPAPLFHFLYHVEWVNFYET